MTGHFSSFEHGHANKKDLYWQPSQLLASYEYNNSDQSLNRASDHFLLEIHVG